MGWKMQCPDCKGERETTCCACGCGNCLTCGHRFSCSPVVFTENSLSLFNKFHESETDKVLCSWLDSDYRVKLLIDKVNELEDLLESKNENASC